MSYVIAAYGLVVGSLVWYAWRLQSQRRQLDEQRRGTSDHERGT